MHSFNSRPSNPKFRLFAIILLLIGGSFLVFFAIIRLNPSLYRKIFMGATSTSPAELDSKPAPSSGLSFSKTDNNDFTNFTNKVSQNLSKNKSDTKNSLNYEALKKELDSFTYTSLSSKQQNTYDQLAFYLDSNIKLASLEKESNSYYEALLESYIGAQKNADEYNAMLDSYIEQYFLDAEGLTKASKHLSDRLTSFTFPTGSSKELISNIKEASSKDFPNAVNAKYSLENTTSDKYPEIISRDSAFYTAPPLSNINASIITVNEQLAKDKGNLWPSLAHNAYPGHMYQATYLANLIKSGKADEIRYYISAAGYTEGFATFAEFKSYDYLKGYEPQLVQLRKDYNQIVICLYSKADIMVNYYGKSKEETCKYLAGYGITESDEQQAVYSYVLEHPGFYAKYGLGFLEFNEMERKAKDLKGDDYSLTKFNKLIMDLGPLPFSAIEKNLYKM